jgi:hypothetical protein
MASAGVRPRGFFVDGAHGNSENRLEAVDGRAGCALNHIEGFFISGPERGETRLKRLGDYRILREIGRGAAS